LKTVYIDQLGRFVKLIIHANHPNEINIHNQVGIVAMNVIGIEEMGLGRKNPIHTSSKPFDDDMPIPTTTIRNNNATKKDFAWDMNLDPNTATKLRLLSEVKAQAVADEDYATAKLIKAIEVDLRSLGTRLAQIDQAKREAVRDEDYDRADILKAEAKELRIDIETKIREVNVPGLDTRMNHPEEPFKNKTQRRVPGMNVDDMPISGYGDGNEPTSARKKNETSRDHMHSSVRDDYEGTGNANKSNKYDGDAKTHEDYDDDDDAGSGEYDGEHPLEGIVNHRDLPAPELISGKSK
jgi:hypothetical protein